MTPGVGLPFPSFKGPYSSRAAESLLLLPPHQTSTEASSNVISIPNTLLRIPSQNANNGLLNVSSYTLFLAIKLLKYGPWPHPPSWNIYPLLWDTDFHWFSTIPDHLYFTLPFLYLVFSDSIYQDSLLNPLLIIFPGHDDKYSHNSVAIIKTIVQYLALTKHSINNSNYNKSFQLHFLPYLVINLCSIHRRHFQTTWYFLRHYLPHGCLAHSPKDFLQPLKTCLNRTSSFLNIPSKFYSGPTKHTVTSIN